MAVGIPINSLQDLLLLRQINEQSTSGFQSLMNGVAAGVKEKQDEARAKRKELDAEAKRLNDLTEIRRTNAGKIEKITIDSKGGQTSTFTDPATTSGKKIYSQAEIAEIKSRPIPSGYNANANFGLGGDQKPYVKTTSSSIPKETDMFSDARDLGIDTTGKSEEQVRIEVTEANSERLLKAKQAVEGVDLTDLVPTVKIDSDGKQTVTYKPKTILGGSVTDEEMTSIIDGMENGSISPSLTTYSRNDRSIIAAAAVDRGLNLNAMTAEQQAVKKWITSTNSVKQVNLRQVIDSVLGSMGNLKKLNEEFERNDWTPANKAEIALAVSGTNPVKRDIATRYLSQITLLTDELGQVFMGGNSPTDKALQLAEKVLNRDYGYQQMVVTLDELEKNIHFRKNAIDSSGPQLPGGQLVGSPLLPPREGSFGDTDEKRERQIELYNQLRADGQSIEYSRGRAGL